MQNDTQTIFDFTENSNISAWRVVDDVVMGGVSQGNFKINENGNGLYFGNVSLENNGGFSSLRYRFDKIDVSNFSKVILKIKGDQKKYQIRIKNKFRNYYSYISIFETSGDWQLVEINLSEMYPAFRGRTLDMENFSSNFIEEIAILIGNKKEQSFQLEIDEIYLQ
jgi:NADH dehydrogenase [ubiquinone] 1 alpha subcomplex assembly factor 1